MAILDHVAIAAGSLDEGTAMVEAALGVELEGGGQHVAMGTHNRLLSLGPGEYLEVIAVDPALAGPDRPRWFDLDRFEGPPAPRAWILRCDDLEASVAAAPSGIGAPMAFERGDLRWRMAVPEDGVLPYDNVFPALIGWDCAAHPAQRLTDRGVRLQAIELHHPDPEGLRAALGTALGGGVEDQRIQLSNGMPGISFVFDTPLGLRRLG